MPLIAGFGMLIHTKSRRTYKIIFVGGNQMRQRSFFDFRLNFRYAKIRFILLIYNFLHV